MKLTGQELKLVDGCCWHKAADGAKLSISIEFCGGRNAFAILCGLQVVSQPPKGTRSTASPGRQLQAAVCRSAEAE
jgi:hypothetical protein